MLVASLRDGMNLVAKEYIARRQDQTGAFVLSEFTCAADDELGNAILVYPPTSRGSKMSSSALQASRPARAGAGCAPCGGMSVSTTCSAGRAAGSGHRHTHPRQAQQERAAGAPIARRERVRAAAARPSPQLQERSRAAARILSVVRATAQACHHRAGQGQARRAPRPGVERGNAERRANSAAVGDLTIAGVARCARPLAGCRDAHTSPAPLAPARLTR